MLALRELCKHLHSPSIHIIFIVEFVCFILENGKIHMMYVKSCCVSCDLSYSYPWTRAATRVFVPWWDLSIQNLLKIEDSVHGDWRSLVKRYCSLQLHEVLVVQVSFSHPQSAAWRFMPSEYIMEVKLWCCITCDRWRLHKPYFLT